MTTHSAWNFKNSLENTQKAQKEFNNKNSYSHQDTEAQRNMWKKHKKKFIISICIIGILNVFVCWKFPYLYWHLYLKHKISKICQLEQLDKELPVRKLEAKTKPQKDWQRIDLLEFSINIPSNPKEVFQNNGKILSFEYPDYKIVIWSIINYRKQINLPIF